MKKEKFIKLLVIACSSISFASCSNSNNSSNESNSSNSVVIEKTQTNKNFDQNVEALKLNLNSTSSFLNDRIDNNSLSFALSSKEDIDIDGYHLVGLYPINKDTGETELNNPISEEKDVDIVYNSKRESSLEGNLDINYYINYKDNESLTNASNISYSNKVHYIDHQEEVNQVYQITLKNNQFTYINGEDSKSLDQENTDSINLFISSFIDSISKSNEDDYSPIVTLIVESISKFINVPENIKNALINYSKKDITLNELINVLANELGLSTEQISIDNQTIKIITSIFDQIDYLTLVNSIRTTKTSDIVKEEYAFKLYYLSLKSALSTIINSIELALDQLNIDPSVKNTLSLIIGRIKPIINNALPSYLTAQVSINFAEGLIQEAKINIEALNAKYETKTIVNGKNMSIDRYLLTKAIYNYDVKIDLNK